jgi:hypothetical protein
MRYFADCRGALCTFEHSYCHTCWKPLCEGGEADVHRSLGHDVQSGLYGPSQPLIKAAGNSQETSGSASRARWRLEPPV